MRTWIILLLLLPVMIGCSAGLPNVAGVTPGGGEDINVRQALNNQWSWGEYKFHINAAHTQVDIVPIRQAQHHYNVKKLLEKGPCTNCIWITYLQKNGDDTMNLGVAIRHPYPGNDFYTGFDVRGIVHFPAEGTVSNGGEWNRHISLQEAGDPELLNADGYCFIWVVRDEPDDDPPLKCYQPGGNLGGGIDWGYYPPLGDVPLNAFKYYHSSENRRYFSTSDVLVRDYHIYIPPGEWDFGYSVDACWAPPLQDPVMNVPDDFPLWANCMANYRLDAEVVGEINGDEPATLLVDVYNYVGPDAPSEVWVYSGDLFTWGITWMGGAPSDLGDHVRWTIPIHNSNDAPPGWYRMAIVSSVKNDMYPGPIEHFDASGAPVWQVVEVQVVN